MLRFEPLPAFEPVRLGAACVCKLPVRGRESFHNLIVSCAGQGYGVSGTALDIMHVAEKVELEQDGVTVFTADPFGLRQLESYANANADKVLNNGLHIPLARLGFGNSDWPTGKMDKLFLKIHTKAALPANSNGNPTLTFTNLLAQARFDLLPEPLARGSVFSVHTASHTTVAGTNTIENLPVGPLRRLTRIIAYCPLEGASLNNAAAHNIEWVRVHVGREKVFDASKEMVSIELAAHPLYRRLNQDDNVPESFPVMFDYTGREADFARLVEGDVRKNVKLEFGWKAGETVKPVNFLIEGALENETAPLKASV